MSTMDTEEVITNPTEDRRKSHYDVIVIGSGPGGG